MAKPAAKIRVVGELMGARRRRGNASVRDEVVRVLVEGRPAGPAINALLLITHTAGRDRSARYISWIGYHDLDLAIERGGTDWKIVDPPARFDEPVTWSPFGSDALSKGGSAGDF